jgi:hypothetical protein
MYGDGTASRAGDQGDELLAHGDRPAVHVGGQLVREAREGDRLAQVADGQGEGVQRHGLVLCHW